jgi:hypothetical protein
LSFRRVVGDSELAIVVVEQHTFEPGAKSDDVLISTSYLAAPATGFQENFGSKSSGSVESRSVTVGVVVDGHDQENEATGDGAPRLPSASTGVTPQ